MKVQIGLKTYTYFWQFEDGSPSTSTQQNPSGIVFTNDNGYKNVRLIVTRNGCTNETNDTIQVITGLTENGNKVTVCHNGNLITVSTNALAAHLAHGDCVGECASNTSNRLIINQSAVNQNSILFEVDLMPNPSNSSIFARPRSQ